MTVSFKTTNEEGALIGKIAARARAMDLTRNKENRRHWYTTPTLVMDLMAVNANGCPMDFERMLDGDDLNFTHDIVGIARHVDRSTGKLTGFFLPRFAKREATRAA